ncbi:MAG: transposase [Nitrospiraceae bacterium]|nr:transposase [Nitrospiraceae bacterium]
MRTTRSIKRGKAGKAIEFGHKVLLAETGEKFIIHYETMAKQRADKDLIQESLNSHGKVFGSKPAVLAGDKGFYESREQIESLSEKAGTVSICKKGRRRRRREGKRGRVQGRAAVPGGHRGDDLRLKTGV